MYSEGRCGEKKMVFLGEVYTNFSKVVDADE